MIELFDQNIRTTDRQSSKGNQLKWENYGIWYKADHRERLFFLVDQVERITGLKDFRKYMKKLFTIAAFF